MRAKGKITSWNNEKGFGFITPNDGGKQIFVHINSFDNRKKVPEINQIVTYSKSTDKQGRPFADKVTRASDRLSQNKKKESKHISIYAAVLFVAIVTLSVLTNKIPFLVLLFYLVVSVFTFLLYSIDKTAAQSDSWRTPESTLHLFSLAGGWPGAIIAQPKLRHKSKKQSFRVVFWGTVLFNFALFIWLHTSTGVTALHSLIGGIL